MVLMLQHKILRFNTYTRPCHATHTRTIQIYSAYVIYFCQQKSYLSESPFGSGQHDPISIPNLSLCFANIRTFGRLILSFSQFHGRRQMAAWWCSAPTKWIPFNLKLEITIHNAKINNHKSQAQPIRLFKLPPPSSSPSNCLIIETILNNNRISY